MLLTDCHNIPNKLLQHNIQKTKTILLQCKNPLFARQKPYFCNAKTILLQRKNHTFTRRICNTQITNTLRTLRECILNGLRMRGEYVYAGTINRLPTAACGLPLRCERSAKMQRTHREKYTKQPQNTWRTFRKHLRNTPPGVGADSSRPYPCITKYTYSHNQICVFKSPHMHFRPPFRGCIHIRGHDKSAPTAACGLP